MKILIAEDDLTCQTFLQRCLGTFGECDVAEDGIEAIAAFSEAFDECQRYDLVCLDIMMPRRSGLDVLQSIRALEAEDGVTGGDAVKVIMTTALAGSSYCEEASRGEVAAYLVKPFEKRKFLKEIEKLGFVPSRVE